MTTKAAITAVHTLSPEYDIPDHLQRHLRRADDFIRMAVICAARAREKAPQRDIAPEQTGVYIGTAYGPLETNFESLGSLIDDGEGQISPTLFSHSVYNSSAGYVARLLNIRGPALTITTYTWPAVSALNEARLAISSGRLQRAVVLGVETYSALLADAYRRSYNTDREPWFKSAVSWILDPADRVEGIFPTIDDIVVTEHHDDPAHYLTRTRESISGRDLPDSCERHPMGYARAMTRGFEHILSGKTGDARQWEIGASFGEVKITLS